MNINELVDAIAKEFTDNPDEQEWDKYQVVFNYEFYKDFEYFIHNVVLDKVKKQLILECDLKGRK